MKKPKTKTAYCKHHQTCDLETNCYRGESCPFFEHNEYFSSMRPEEEEDRGSWSMDEVWDGTI